MNTNPAEFELIIEEVEGPDHVEIEGKVVSVALDSKMHPDGMVDLYISTTRNTLHGRPGFVLDSFQLRSLQEYLERQADVCAVLEEELPKDQEEMDPTGEAVRGNVWSWARVRQLQLRLRDVQSPDAVERLRKAGLSDEQIGESFPKPESPRTHTFFVISIECDWAVDYGLEATFRDGHFVCLEPF